MIAFEEKLHLPPQRIHIPQLDSGALSRETDSEIRILSEGPENQNLSAAVEIQNLNPTSEIRNVTAGSGEPDSTKPSPTYCGPQGGSRTSGRSGETEGDPRGRPGETSGDCVHHWRIESPHDGHEVLDARCRECGATREYRSGDWGTGTKTGRAKAAAKTRVTPRQPAPAKKVAKKTPKRISQPSVLSQSLVNVLAHYATSPERLDDGEIALRIGCGESTVCWARKKLARDKLLDVAQVAGVRRGRRPITGRVTAKGIAALEELLATGT